MRKKWRLSWQKRATGWSRDTDALSLTCPSGGKSLPNLSQAQACGSITCLGWLGSHWASWVHIYVLVDVMWFLDCLLTTYKSSIYFCLPGLHLLSQERMRDPASIHGLVQPVDAAARTEDVGSISRWSLS